MSHEKPASSLAEDQYSEVITKAREESPSLIKRMSNTISDEDRSRLIDPDEQEFNPIFSYPNLFDLDEAAIASKDAIIQEGLVEAADLESQGYHLSIDNQFDKRRALDGLASLRLLNLAQRIHSEIDVNEREKLISEFMELNEQMTGPIDVDLYQGIVNSLHDIISDIKESQPLAKRVSLELASMLPAPQGEAGISSLPEDVFNEYRNAYEVIFGKWLTEIIPKKEGLYDANELAEVFTNAINSMKLDELGWEAVISEDATSLKISMADKTITIPAKRKLMTYEQLAPKVVHEVGHMTRGLNGATISRSAENGLPDYLDAEEGLMSYGESFINGKQQPDATYIERYVGVATMNGAISTDKRDFKHTFATMWRVRALLENADWLKTGGDISNVEIGSAKESSLMNAQRLFRGGDGSEPGLGWTKDKAYYEGVAKLTDFMVDFAQRLGIENIHWLFAAKFDPTNSLHNQYLGMPLKGE